MTREELIEIIENCEKEGKDVSLMEANLSNQDLSGLVITNGFFYKTNFSNSYLADCNFQGCNFSHANFKSAILKNSNLKNTNLFFANFKGADLEGVDFYYAILEGASFSDHIHQIVNYVVNKQQK